MKKSLIIAVFMLAGTCLFANTNKGLDEQVRTEVNLAVFNASRHANPYENTVFKVTLDVSSRFENQAQADDNTIRKWCSVVRIAPNWLIGSLTCRGTSETATATDHNGISYTKRVASRKIEGVRLGGFAGRAQVGAAKIAKQHIFEDESSKTFLIYVADGNYDFREKLDKQGNIANLLIADKPQDVLKEVNKAYVTYDGKSSEVEIERYGENKCYHASRKGHSGDPLFLLNKKGIGFLAGLNVAEVDGTDVQKSKDYKAFNSATFNFLKRTIEPKDSKAWSDIVKSMVKAF